MAFTYSKLAETTLASSTAAITFNNIPQNYTDLILRVSGRSTRSDYTFGSISITFNKSAVTTYSYNWLKGDGTNPNTGTGSAVASILDLYTMPSSTATANTFGNNDIYIPNYTSSNNKSVSIDGVSENNATLSQVILTAGLWANTTAINSITLTETNGNNFAQYSTAYLYGIRVEL